MSPCAIIMEGLAAGRQARGRYRVAARLHGPPITAGVIFTASQPRARMHYACRVWMHSDQIMLMHCDSQYDLRGHPMDIFDF